MSLELITSLSNYRIYRSGIWDLHAKWGSASLAFKVLERVAPASPLFVRKTNGPTEDANCADVVLSGFIRFDDCCQWNSPNIHTDSKEELSELLALVSKIYDIAHEVIED